MARISDFFGIRVGVVRDLDKTTYASFLDIFVKWLDQHPDIKARSPHLYIHKLTFDIEPKHYEVNGIDNRISKFEVSVSVNEKQQKNETMHFINNEIGHRLSPKVKHDFGMYKNSYLIEGGQMLGASHFEEYLATVVLRTISPRDRKVKCVFSAYATPAYGARLRNVALPVVSKTDFYLNRAVQLRLPFEANGNSRTEH